MSVSVLPRRRSREGTRTVQRGGHRASHLPADQLTFSLLQLRQFTFSIPQPLGDAPICSMVWSDTFVYVIQGKFKVDSCSEIAMWPKILLRNSTVWFHLCQICETFVTVASSRQLNCV